MKNSFIRRADAGHTLLIVDDSELNCDLLANIFESEYKIEIAHDGLEGLRALEKSRPEFCAILLDVVMPVMDGITMLEKLAADDVPSQIPVFLITGETDGKVIAKAYNLGVMDVISKPFSPYVVQRRVNSVIELFTARNHFAEIVARQTEELRDQNRRLQELNQGMIETLATATEFRSGESGEHVRRIHDITHAFLTESPLKEEYTPEEIELIANASILHDVGKISIPDAILNKPGRLTTEEFELMKKHAENGDQMLTQIPQLRNLPFYSHARAIARHHHERWDGRGYPDGLAGDDIPVPAQIVAIADVYDALVSERVYKPPFPHEKAVAMISEGECGSFNPRLIKYFNDIAPLLNDIYKKNRQHEKQGTEHGSK